MIWTIRMKDQQHRLPTWCKVGHLSRSHHFYFSNPTLNPFGLNYEMIFIAIISVQRSWIKSKLSQTDKQDKKKKKKNRKLSLDNKYNCNRKQKEVACSLIPNLYCSFFVLSLPTKIVFPEHTRFIPIYSNSFLKNSFFAIKFYQMAADIVKPYFSECKT